jgi:hypothetical protein
MIYDLSLARRARITGEGRLVHAWTPPAVLPFPPSIRRVGQWSVGDHAAFKAGGYCKEPEILRGIITAFIGPDANSPTLARVMVEGISRVVRVRDLWPDVQSLTSSSRKD